MKSLEQLDAEITIQTAAYQGLATVIEKTLQRQKELFELVIILRKLAEEQTKAIANLEERLCNHSNSSQN